MEGIILIKLNFMSVPGELATGIDLLQTELGYQIAADGVPITAQTQVTDLTVTYQEGQATIAYPYPAAFFRGLTALVAAIKTDQPLQLNETPQFTTSGLMIDMSRNAALNLTGLKQMIRLSAKLGLNAALLYMEDVYQVEDYPYWGYQRGRLTESELQAADDYAHSLGVELIPCIQTLAHLINPMKWHFMDQIRDTDGILLVDEPKTYDFLRKIIAAATRPFRSQKIHIGMDEAHDLGRGIYLNQHGWVDRTKIMLDHVRQVIAITKSLDLDAIMWSDMWFNAAGFGYGDPQTVFPEDLKEQIPEVDLMYWDYYNNSQENYEQVLRLQQELGTPVSFATGVWTWNGLAPNYGKTMRTMAAGMAGAKKVGVKTVYATMWGDDGGETPFTAGALGIQAFAEQVYHQATPTSEALAAAFSTYQNKQAANYWLLDEFDQLPELTAGNPDATNPSKILLYEDLLHPLFQANFAQVDLARHYQQLQAKLDQVQVQPDETELFRFYQELARTLVLKNRLLTLIQQHYQAQDRSAMAQVVPELTKLAQQLTALQTAHRQVWLSLYSPFGWEVMDIRYGGLIARCHSSQVRLMDWADGTVNTLPELTEPNLVNGTVTANSIGRGLYSEIVTTSKISGV